MYVTSDIYITIIHNYIDIHGCADTWLHTLDTPKASINYIIYTRPLQKVQIWISITFFIFRFNMGLKLENLHYQSLLENNSILH